jgi:eukaryotic-like serine/threonine-protein kinase
MPLGVGQRLGVYEVIAPLGAGGMGEVYRARDTRLRRDVALKVLHDHGTANTARERLLREARAAAALNHPNICTVHEVDDTAGFIAMELVAGQPLNEVIRRGALAPSRVCRMGAQVADALDHAHRQGVIHRDFKSANVIVTPDDRPVIVDFGIARVATGGGEGTTELLSSDHVPGHLAGTLPYMAPEVLQGADADARSDIWALGVVLHEMIAGKLPFARATASEVSAAILRDPPAPLPHETLPALGAVVRRALAKNAPERYRTAGEVRAALELVGAVAEVPETSVVGVETPAKQTRRWRAVALGLGAALVATALVAMVAITRRTGVAPADWATGLTQATQLTNYGGTETAAALSPDGRSFVFVSNHGGTPDLWLRQIAGGDPVRLTNDVEGEAHPIFAPDGESIYFTRFDKEGPSIWRIGALGGQVRKVIAGGQLPSPSPDGRELAYHTARADSLVVASLAGGNPRSIASDLLGAVLNTRASWSPDGRQLAFTRQGLFVPLNLFVADVASGETRQVTRFTRSSEGIQSHTWMPDNRHLVVSYSPFARQPPTNDLGMLDVTTGSIVRLTIAVGDTLFQPSVSNDGMRLVATSRRFTRELWKVPNGPDPAANGRGAVRLLDGTWDVYWTFGSREGRTLLFSSPFSGSRNLWSMPIDGSARPRQITEIAGSAVAHSSLSPDGSQVAFVSSASGNSDIWVQNVDGSGLRQLTDDAAADAWPVWSPEGRRIVFASTREDVVETLIIPSSGGATQRLMAGPLFRGDWIDDPSGRGGWIVTCCNRNAVRFIDVDGGKVIWEERAAEGFYTPVFSPDGRSFSLPQPDGQDRDAIWIYDVETRRRTLAVRFSEPFRVAFPASWTDGGKAFVVNRNVFSDHVVLFDRFWTRPGADK